MYTLAMVYKTDQYYYCLCIDFKIVFAVDSIAPVITCIEDVSTTVQLGTTSTAVSWIEPTATDNSGVVNLVSRSHAPGSSFGLGTTQVTYTFADGSNNIATCTFAVTVTAGTVDLSYIHYCILIAAHTPISAHPAYFEAINHKIINHLPRSIHKTNMSST